MQMNASDGQTGLKVREGGLEISSRARGLDASGPWPDFRLSSIMSWGKRKPGPLARTASVPCSLPPSRYPDTRAWVETLSNPNRNAPEAVSSGQNTGQILTVSIKTGPMSLPKILGRGGGHLYGFKRHQGKEGGELFSLQKRRPRGIE